MKFTKMQGIGNDYIYVNCFEETVNDPERVSQIVSDRHFGIGGDGLVLIMPSDKADFRMRMFNADGSEGNMCGNATRCIGKFVYDNGLTDKTEITLETRSGIKYLTLYPENGKVKTVLVNMGKAILKPSDIPMKAEGDSFINKPMKVLGKDVFITAVSMGNPHAVTYVEDVDGLELEKIGPEYENHPLFPERVNTEFIKVLDSHTIQMRVWERGSGETWACGTGACAAAVASVENGYFKRGEEITVKLRGGDLFITYEEDGTVLMRGPAETVFTGEIDV
ncbi:MAG: diaminopimelate epimerase [Oscillospiraceae bacterium]|nr:diaminopimelate epimerase [Oscillospiraceae bacterium]MDY6208883.1 diaminopimelate epimerase [Oscillospiraceae bacterium]